MDLYLQPRSKSHSKRSFLCLNLHFFGLHKKTSQLQASNYQRLILQMLWYYQCYFSAGQQGWSYRYCWSRIFRTSSLVCSTKARRLDFFLVVIDVLHRFLKSPVRPSYLIDERNCQEGYFIGCKQTKDF